MRAIGIAALPLLVVASFAVVSCSDDRPVCAASGPKPGGGSSSSRSTTTRSSTTSRTTTRNWSRNTTTSTSRDRPVSVMPTRRLRSSVTRVQVNRVRVNNRTVIVQHTPQVRYDGWRWYPDYGAWYPPHVWPYGYAAAYDCALPGDAVEDGQDW